MSSQDAILWNAMIEGYVKVGKSREAIELFEEMQESGMIPTSVTFVVLLEASMTLGESKHIHNLISCHGFDTNLVVGTSLMNMYSRCCSLGDIYKVFDKMTDHDMFSWNALLAAVSRHGSSKTAFCMFQMMLFEGIIPNCVSFINLCDSCDTSATFKEATWIHALILASKLEKDSYVIKSIITMYGKVGNLGEVRRVFEENGDGNEIACNALIVACSLMSQTMQALSIYRQMQVEGTSQGRFTLINLIFGFVNTDTISEGRRVHATVVKTPFEEDQTVINAFLNMYGKCGRLEEAKTLFKRAHNQDTYSWSVMLAAYARHNEGRAAVITFHRMLLQCVLPDEVTLISMVSGCSTQGFIAEGRQLHVCILETGFRSDLNLSNALISMYGKCGSVKDAFEVFRGLQACSVLSWNALLSVCALHGRGKETLQLYYRMQESNVTPDEVTYSIVLSACSHSGLLTEGLECFIALTEINGVKYTDKHVTCVINLLCRVGLLDEGESIVKILLSQPSSIAWTTLLGFCNMHCDGERGKRLASNALQLDPKNSSLYVLLSNIYASPTGKDEMIDQEKRNVMMQSSV